MSSAICRGPDALFLCCNAAASCGGNRKSESNAVWSKFSVLCLSSSSSKVPYETVVADASAAAAAVWKANYGLVAKNLSSSCSAVLVPVIAAAARRPRSASFELGGDCDDEDDDWALDIFEDFDNIEEDGVGIEKTSSRGDMKLGSGRRGDKVDDWAERARQIAVVSIQERGLPVAALLDERRTKKKKKRRKTKKQSEDVKLNMSFRVESDRRTVAFPAEYVEPVTDNHFMSTLGSGDGFQELSALGNYWKNLNQTGEIRMQEDVRPKDVELLIESDFELVGPELKSRVSKGFQTGSSRQRRQEDFDLNRNLVEASSASDVLFVVSSVLESSPWQQCEYSLSPTNISTALHRIAKHMEAESMHKSDRLSFARQKTMALLVSAATEALPQCSAQSVSNIAWALSKVGGICLYWAEMDLLAQAAMSNISDLEPQHIANIAGAFASMQHSVPALFMSLDQRAGLLYRNFQSQELAQLLWAFATLNEPAKVLLDSIDSEFETSDQAVHTVLSGYVPDSDQPSTSWTSGESYFSSFSLSELFNLAWSYTVLNELTRPSFALLWNEIVKRSQENSAEVQRFAGQSAPLSQLHQASLSLELEYPELNLRPGERLGSLVQSGWEKLKFGKTSTSATQKDVEMLLVSTGRQWVGEYSVVSYSLDVALVEERIALEIDGPTHFARNTGAALGHTVLKQRQLSAAGWTVLCIPYLEWDELLGEQEQMEYLRNLLKNHL